jgi:broad specificity phosphatase PhoE
LNTKTIYLIRHGETEFNRQGIVQGSGINSDLNEVGKAQAKAFFENYRHVAFDKIYISKLIRTKQSVQNFINLGIPFEKYEGLNEISWGVNEGKIPNFEHDETFTNLLENWRNGNILAAMEGGEHPQEVAERQKNVIETILSRPEENTILIAMHGRAMRILLTQLLEKPLTEMDDFEHSNLCLYKLEYSYETKSFSMEIANDITHLMLLEV